MGVQNFRLFKKNSDNPNQLESIFPVKLRVVLSTSRILGVKDLGAEMELQLPLEVASEFPPEIFARHRHRHFENLVSRKMQSLCNPKIFYCLYVSLPCLSKYQSLPHHPRPIPLPHCTACLSLSSVRACKVQNIETGR